MVTVGMLRQSNCRFFGRDTIDIVGSCMNKIRFRIYHLFSCLKILIIRIFFNMISDFSKETHPK